MLLGFRGYKGTGGPLSGDLFYATGSLWVYLCCICMQVSSGVSFDLLIAAVVCDVHCQLSPSE